MTLGSAIPIGMIVAGVTICAVSLHRFAVAAIVEDVAQFDPRLLSKHAGGFSHDDAMWFVAGDASAGNLALPSPRTDTQHVG